MAEEYRTYESSENAVIENMDGVLTDAQIAALLDRTPKAIENQRLRLRARRTTENLRERMGENITTLIPRVAVPASTKPHYLNHPVIEAENVVVCNDVHLPYQDAPFINNVLNLALAWGVENLIFGGDLLDTAAYSSFGPDPTEVLEDEMLAAEELFQSIAGSFTRILWTLGNHEARAFKQFERQIKVNRFLRMITSEPNVIISSYEWCEIRQPSNYKECGCRDENRHDWRIVHQGAAPTVGGKAALDISSVWTRHHVINAHDHVVGLHRTKDGERWAIGTGMCGDPTRIEYSSKAKKSARPEMQRGALIVMGRRPYLLTPESDFSALGNLYQDGRLAA